jgi:hypothetical protein
VARVAEEREEQEGVGCKEDCSSDARNNTSYQILYVLREKGTHRGLEEEKEEGFGSCRWKRKGGQCFSFGWKN